MDKTQIITIDGPAGAGKSTLSKNLAQALGWNRLDTGAIYRAVALAAKESGLGPQDAQQVGLLAEKLDLSVKNHKAESRVFIGSRDVTGLIRNLEISALSSIYSSEPRVRAALLELQRRLGARGALVTEGRDMGTVVFPWAKLKFFLVADVGVRAERRYLQLIRKGVSADKASVLANLASRDLSDSSRSAAPLKPAPEALIIDSSNLSLFQVETIMLGKAKEVFGL
ncbi:MAG: (d)CMP kinase [Deltaproteobacteria bacterium]|jgi:cytidylate kinase|nr:(d)CMP kinase [Deltaproteobacteria bacterium]